MSSRAPQILGHTDAGRTPKSYDFAPPHLLTVGRFLQSTLEDWLLKATQRGPGKVLARSPPSPLGPPAAPLGFSCQGPSGTSGTLGRWGLMGCDAGR